MKSLFNYLFIFFLWGAPNILSAQSIDFGVLTSANFSAYGVKGDSPFRNNFDYPLNYGGSIGLAIKYSPSNQQISRKFPLRPIFQSEGKISTNFMLVKSTNERSNILQETYELTRFELNLMGGVDFKRKFQLLIGPTFNTIIAATKTVDFKVGGTRTFAESDAEFKRFGIGLNTSFGYKWKFLLFSVQYERQITDFRTSIFRNPVNFKMNTLRLGTTFFLFNKNNEKNRDSLFGL